MSTPPLPLRENGHGELKWVLLAALAVPLGFAVFTQHVWEDYYITFRSSRNLAEGLGLVFTPGERLHTFTSPLGVLLPALLRWLTRSDEATLWCFRLVASGALAASIGLLWETLREHGISRAARVIATALLLFNPCTIDFSINGMEAPFLMAFTMLGLRELARPAGIRPLVLGAAWAGMMWTRPDAFVPGAAITAGLMLFRRELRTAGALKALIGAAVWATVMYGPWVAWAWWYYGTPVPHTITAKAGLAAEITLPRYLVSTPLSYLAGTSVMSWLFMPAYFFFGGWSNEWLSIAQVLAVVAGFAWVLRLPPLARAASFALLLGCFYLQAIPLFPWYLPVWVMFAALALGCAAAEWLEAFPSGHRGRSIARCLVAIVLCLQAGILGLTAWQFRNQQRLIEDGGRRQIGEWLAVNARPGETVFLESLGYIGYFSQLRMLDYPGLASREVVQARRVSKNFAELVANLRPDWLVLRPTEIANYGFLQSRVLEDYEQMRVWDAQPGLAQVQLLPGRPLLARDAVFIVFRRRGATRETGTNAAQP